MVLPRSTLRQRLAEIHPRAAVAWAVFVAACALIALLHLFKLGIDLDQKELWGDEASTFLIAQYPLPRAMQLAVAYHSQPPLYYALLHFLSKIGTSEAVIRGLSWSFCLGLLGFVMIELNELRIVSRFVFCLAFLFHPYSLYLAQELRPYSLSALTTLVASVLLLRFVARPRERRAAIAYGVAAVVMVYSLAFDVGTLLMHGVLVAFVILASLRRSGVRATARELWPLVAVLGAASVLYLPYVIDVSLHVPSPTRAPLLAKLGAALTPAHFTAYLIELAPAGASAVLVVLSLILFGLAREHRREPRAAWLWLLVFFGQVAFCHGFLYGLLPVSFRYMTPAFPVFLLTVALGVDHLVAPKAARLWPVLLALLGMVVWQAWAPWRASLYRAPPPTNWRRLYAEVQKIDGKKAFFFDVGGYAQMLEYVARGDRSIDFYTNQFEWIPGTGMGTAGKFMTREYVAKTLAARAADYRCLFFSRDHRGKEWGRDSTVYEATFVPTMAKLGYLQVFQSESGPLADPFHDYFLVTGFCRR